MRVPTLSLQQTPPLRLPVGYFQLGVWFGVGAGVFLWFAGAEAWSSRWMPAMLGATHLLVLGCVVTVMMGALLQVLPVISGAQVWGAERMAPWIRAMLATGAITLGAALTLEARTLFFVAGVALLAAFLLYLLPVAWSVRGRVGGGDSMVVVRIAIGCLFATVALGVTLVVGHAAPEVAPGYRAWTDLHVRFGLLGWIALLIMAVSFQVLPMFFVAPNYPRWITLGVPVAIVVGLVLGNAWILTTCGVCYGAATLAVLRRRKRRAPDPTVRFWQAGAVVLIVVAVFRAAAKPLGLAVPELLFGVLFVVGFVLTVMVGMLYKIVPFLVFLHLQRACLPHPERFSRLPTMHSVIPTSRARWQLGLHGATIAACVAAATWPIAYRVAALALVVEFGWLAASIRVARRCYVGRYAELSAPAAALP